MKFNLPFTKSNDDTKYEPLKEAFLSTTGDSADSASYAERHNSTQTPPFRWRLASYCGKTMLVILALVGIITLMFQAQSKLVPRKLPSCACGESAQESLDMGCKFDTLAHGWLQPHCIDDELTEEFDHSGPGPNGEWSFWRDANGTLPISVEERAMQDHDAVVYSTFGWHLNHCFFYWRKQYRARFRSHIVEGKYDNEFHIVHCMHKNYARTPLLEIGTTASTYLDTDHSSHERHFSDSVREMFLVDHYLKDPSDREDPSKMHY